MDKSVKPSLYQIICPNCHYKPQKGISNLVVRMDKSVGSGAIRARYDVFSHWKSKVLKAGL